MNRVPLSLSILVSVLLLSFAVRAQDGPYLLVRVDANPEVKLLPLLELGLDIVDGVKDQYLDAVCFPEDLARIRAMGYSTEVLIPDMERFYRDRALAEGLATDDMGGFHTLAECEAHIDSIHNVYPNITTAPWSIGNSLQGRAMRVIKISDNPNVDENEPEIFFNGLTHAREPIGMEICLALIDLLTSHYATDPQIANLVNNREIFFMPIVNPDGYYYNQQTNPGGGGMWRKNRRLNSGGSYGVDLNRNYGFNWGYNNVGSSPTQSAEDYRGTGPFSEPETQNVRQFCDTRYFALAQNFHSYSNLMLYSWSIPSAPWGYTPDNAAFVAMSQYMQQYNGYTYGPPWEILYEVNGDANDWMYGEQSEKPKTLAWVFEVGASSFWPAPSQIPGLIAENIQPCLYMIDQSVNYVPLPVSLSYVSGVINDQVGGNGNGGLDPGESVTFIPTIRNNGWVAGTGITATLMTADPYVTITSANSSYPNLNPHAQGAANTPYALSASNSCPYNHTTQFGLIWHCNEGYSDTALFSIIIGNPMYQPLGPDAYGYRAYDIYDEGGPTYNWLEVDPSAGGSGTPIPYTVDDQTVQLNLPFTFQYYGQDFIQISVCSNGWVAMGSTTNTDYSNSAIPNADGPPNMIAPFWEDLSPQTLGRVAYYYNSAQHFYVVEFDSVRQYTPTTARETFEVVLYDPAFYQTQTGDGQILCQYKQVSDPTSCTVGIENQAQTVGLQVLYDASLNANMGPMQTGMAYLFTTAVSASPVNITMTPVNPPIEILPTGGSFSFTVSIQNAGTSPATFDGWIMQQLPSGPWQGPMLGPIRLTLPGNFTLTRTRSQNVPASAPAGVYLYEGYVGLYSSGVKWDSSGFNYTKLASGMGPLVVNWNNYGDSFEPWMTKVGDQAFLPEKVTLAQNYPNPFNPLTSISYGLPVGGFVSLKVYDLMGREVAVLQDGYRSAGLHQVSWDASHQASGIYLYVLSAGNYRLASKCLLVK